MYYFIKMSDDEKRDILVFEIVMVVIGVVGVVVGLFFGMGLGF